VTVEPDPVPGGAAESDPAPGGAAESDPALLTLVSAREQLRAGRLSATELTRAVLARVERLNESLNAYLRVDGEAALARRKQPTALVTAGRWPESRSA
jgi:aspartyl-tRNA(Asn)/glutamyl-tRNA(Gln) amidotransferase subunit A